MSVVLSAGLIALFYWGATLVGQQDTYIQKPHAGSVAIAGKIAQFSGVFRSDFK